MKLNKIVIAMGTAVAMCAGTVYAADSTPSTSTTTVTGGTIHFTGELVDAPCAVSTDSDGQIVKLGEYTVHHITNEKKGSEVPFTIKLEDCDTSTASTAAVAFQGTQDENSATLLAVDSGTDDSNEATASGVGIKITDSASKVVPVDASAFSTPVNLIDGENVLNFKAQYIADGASVAAGKANADATFIMQYQ
ncbi:type-1 fimbrial protein subunit A [Erwinia endophytica]|uniref:type 1 fimbrial major subunit FimA n=1 Tax=Erwinia endophytica TaxID=1563158 RepID=UPI001265F216|nr:type 1 fimbrial major subunit FimA [Erwinia endophytica]KAB8312633.1 type-1 fimbrial protein subunit A [Erwinia endophytica]